MLVTLLINQIKKCDNVYIWKLSRILLPKGKCEDSADKESILAAISCTVPRIRGLPLQAGKCSFARAAAEPHKPLATPSSTPSAPLSPQITGKRRGKQPSAGTAHNIVNLEQDAPQNVKIGFDPHRTDRHP